MNLHSRVMNIQLADLGAHNRDYREGHRDARHAAAEIANEADAEIERLRALLRRVSVGVGHYHGPWGPCDACDIEAALVPK